MASRIDAANKPFDCSIWPDPDANAIVFVLEVAVEVRFPEPVFPDGDGAGALVISAAVDSAETLRLLAVAEASRSEGPGRPEEPPTCAVSAEVIVESAVGTVTTSVEGHTVVTSVVL